MIHPPRSPSFSGFNRDACGDGKLRREKRSPFRSFLALCLVLQFGASVAGAHSLEALFQDPNLWEARPEAFLLPGSSYGFVWNSAQKDIAQSIRRDLTLGSVPVVEATARFSSQKLMSLTLHVYTRGDSGGINRRDFETLLEQTQRQISTLTRSKPQSLGQSASNAVRAEGVQWKAGGALWTLLFSVTRKNTPKGAEFIPEFIRVEIAQEKTVPKTGFTQIKTAVSKPKDHVRKLDSGDTFIEGIPMVDQGDKGYCFPATAERILRYYGMRADQHEIAQLAGSGERGTRDSEGVEGLRRAGTRLQFRVRMVDEFSVADVEKLVREYNQRTAKYGSKAQIPPLRGAVDVEALYRGMRPEIFEAARLSQKLEKNKFVRAIQGAVDSGNPMAWSVLMGFGKKEAGIGQQTAGHARVILGYNAKTQECLYSDSWGPGHELKRMTFDQAWLMHLSCFLLLPQGVEAPSLSENR